MLCAAHLTELETMSDTAKQVPGERVAWPGDEGAKGGVAPFVEPTGLLTLA